MKVAPHCESAFPLKFRAMCLLFIFVFPLFATIAIGRPKRKKYEITWVRGKIEHQGKVNYPAGKVAVTLTPRESKSDQAHPLLSYTGEDGMFDFHVPAGTYVLKVWLSGNESKDFLIKVDAKKYFDVAPIIIP
jgi:hypothetical protein